MEVIKVSNDIEILDAHKLKKASESILKLLRRIFEEFGFTSRHLHEISGKRVTRHTNISHREKIYLQQQILYDQKELGVLVDLFLLSCNVEKKKIVEVLAKDIFLHLLELGILEEVGADVVCPAHLTPLSDNYFLNDGEKHNDHQEHIIQIVLEQPYLIEVSKIVLESKFNKNDCKHSVLDICTGSGVIGQGIQHGKWSVLGLDINWRAIEYSRFNAKLNGFSQNSYSLQNIAKETPDGKYDVVISNPPYNAMVSVDGWDKSSDLDITLHAGVFGNQVSKPIMSKAYNLLNDDGIFFMVGTTLLKNGKIWHPDVEELSEKGTLIFLHKVIAPATSWEAIRLLFSTTPNYDKLAPGVFKKLVHSNNGFNEVSWGIIIFIKGGTPGYHLLYNLPTDGELIETSKIKDLKALIDL